MYKISKKLISKIWISRSRQYHNDHKNAFRITCPLWVGFPRNAEFRYFCFKYYMNKPSNKQSNCAVIWDPIMSMWNLWNVNVSLTQHQTDGISDRSLRPNEAVRVNYFRCSVYVSSSNPCSWNDENLNLYHVVTRTYILSTYKPSTQKHNLTNVR